MARAAKVEAETKTRLACDAKAEAETQALLAWETTSLVEKQRDELQRELFFMLILIWLEKLFKTISLLVCSDPNQKSSAVL